MERKKLSLRPNGNALVGGGYSLILTAVVLAILVVVNYLVSVLPATWTKLDISAAQLYSITSNTKVVVNSLQKDVTIYWIVQADSEDTVLENLLAKYEALSSHIDVVKKNPDVFPTFAQQYTSETVTNNALVVECGDKSRYIAYSDIYITEANLYSYSYTTSFDGEGAITSAIDYVVSDDLPLVYLLEGHGEAELPSTFADQIEKENIETAQLSLLTLEAVPEDADCVFVYSPASDLSEVEAELLEAYVENGGKLLVMAGALDQVSLPNLNGILENYGVTVEEGIVVESDQNYYFYGYPYLLLPDLDTHGVTNSLISEHYYALMSLCNGLSIGSSTAEPLLTTSGTAFLKTAGYGLTTYDREEGDVEGPFHLAVSAADGNLIWFASGDFLDDAINAYSSGANGDLAMNALSSLIGETESMAIRSKSLNYNYLTISESTSATLKWVLIGLVPLGYFGVGLMVIFQKRRREHETV